MLKVYLLLDGNRYFLGEFAPNQMADIDFLLATVPIKDHGCRRPVPYIVLEDGAAIVEIKL